MSFKGQASGALVNVLRSRSQKHVGESHGPRIKSPAPCVSRRSQCTPCTPRPPQATATSKSLRFSPGRWSINTETVLPHKEATEEHRLPSLSLSRGFYHIHETACTRLNHTRRAVRKNAIWRPPPLNLHPERDSATPAPCEQITRESCVQLYFCCRPARRKQEASGDTLRITPCTTAMHHEVGKCPMCQV